MSLLLLTVTLRGVSNKHCLLPLFSFKLFDLQYVDKSGTATQFLDGSNRFYTLIPHDFGMKKPPMLDTAEIIKVI